MINKKIILTGSFGVGKTSLFNQFIYSKFSEKYLTTIGVKVDKKVVKIGDRELTLMIWDIAGEVTQDKVPLSYFLGTHGIIYVYDLTRMSTAKNAKSDIEYLQEQIGSDGVVKLVGNKVDIATPEQIDASTKAAELETTILTSAKTGDNVSELFNILSTDLLSNEK